MDYFPLTIAKNNAFCNRIHELKQLVHNIREAKPTLIMSPRRYGKTSLAIRALEESRSVYAHIDLYRDITEEHIERSIMNGIGVLLGKLESIPKKLLSLANDFFSGMQVNLILNNVNVTVGLPEKKRRSSDNILHALQRLHDLSKKRNKKVVLFFDEFQQLGEIVKDHAVEAAIRQAVQLSTHVTYIFSGSHRHLLQNMFFDKTRPFYKLCDLILLNRIEEVPYTAYLQKAAKERWKQLLLPKVLQQILILTEQHPYYINLLCTKLWLGIYPKNEKVVFDIWERCALENKSQIEQELSLLSLNQRILLIALATAGSTSHPHGKEFLEHVSLSQTSVSQALSTLVMKDYIFQNGQQQYQLLDPLIAFLLHDSRLS